MPCVSIGAQSSPCNGCRSQRSCECALPLALLQLVFSDEFNSPGRKMGVGAGDPRWTADSLWYLGTFDEEVYTPEQVGGLHHKASKRSILLKGH